MEPSKLVPSRSQYHISPDVPPESPIPSPKQTPDSFYISLSYLAFLHSSIAEVGNLRPAEFKLMARHPA